MKKTILIIDDDNRNIFALSAILKLRGYEICTASNMIEAFAILENNSKIDIILLDMMMPGMDGYEATATLKADKRFFSIPVIAVTAQAMKGDKEKCLAVGADNYISKPVDIDYLMELLKAGLS